MCDQRSRLADGRIALDWSLVTTEYDTWSCLSWRSSLTPRLPYSSGPIQHEIAYSPRPRAFIYAVPDAGAGLAVLVEFPAAYSA